MKTSCAVFILGQIASRGTIGPSGYIYIESEIQRLFTVGVSGSEVRFSAVDGVIAVIV